MSNIIFPSAFEPFFQGEGGHLRVFKSGPATQVLTALALMARGRDAVLLAPGAAEFKELAALLELFSGPEKIGPAWGRDWLKLGPHLAREPGVDWGERFAVLHGLRYGSRPKGLLLTVDNLLTLWPAPEVVESNWLTLSRGDEISIDMIREQCAEWGYSAGKVVTEPGEMAVRGDILDIHAPGYPLPLRLEFFGDVLEEIRLFDPASQRSKSDLVEATVLPVRPAVLSGGHPDEARALWERLRRTGELSSSTALELGERLDRFEASIWPGLYYKDPVHLERYVHPDATWILSSSQQLRHRLEDGAEAWRTLVAALSRDKGVKLPFELLCRKPESARKSWLSASQIVFEDLTVGVEKNGIDMAERVVSEFADMFWRPEQISRPFNALMDGVSGWKREGWRTALSFRSPRARSRFLSLAEGSPMDFRLDWADETGKAYALISPLRKGMELSWCNLRILGEDILQPEPVRRTTGKDKAFEGLSRYDDLAEDDLLVHRDYGLSRFQGLYHMDVGGVENDYLLLHFDGDDRLYLPVDRLNLVQRYKGPEGTTPSLDRLGGTRWAKTTAKVRKAIEKIAHDLVEMYAFRRVTKGYGYPPLDEMYREFESTFGFDETPDQERAVNDVFADMEKPEPMDRLVCGDVGFGKTEVALRAAFRTVQEGRQVALLCPTTVLAEQHYQTFTQRMEGFPIRVGMLSRFVPAARQKTTLAAAARGEIDILIGTHRLLSKDVELPRLGMLILDEEQRFGVKHKEKLKQMRKTVDALTLTATPIPRTLQLSLSGVRGLSVIETPPVDRKPVTTALIERDESVLKAALHRELERGGQVFWVYNRVQGLERAVELVKKLAPEARVGMAHGQMNERQLEDAMHKFWHKELDVLVCTAIIESGLDFPNVNTLIVDQAQMFGLGQLYQLRGRVGRSARQAYAYFVVPSLDNLPEVSRRRLRIVLEMDYLGAGFKVAMEDLRLRGAGNILGEAQSGQIAKVGLDLFLEMLEDEVRRVRGEGGPIRPEPELNFVFEAHLPEGWIPDSRERLRYYKALSTAPDQAGLTDLEAELRDRFGPPPEEAVNFLAVLALKRTLADLGALRADLFTGRAKVAFDPEAGTLDPDKVIVRLAEGADHLTLTPPATLTVRWPETESVACGLALVQDELIRLSGGNDTEERTT